VKDPVGVVHGRFQLLHNDHVRYILDGREHCDHLIIGICNPDERLTKYTKSNPHRSLKENNPFTYYERYQMIKGTLVSIGISTKEFDIVPFPINYPKRIFNYVPRDAKFYMTIYDAWGYEKKEALDSIGCKTEVLREVSLAEKGISGSAVRKLIKEKRDWNAYVPAYVYDYIIHNENLLARIC